MSDLAGTAADAARRTGDTVAEAADRVGDKVGEAAGQAGRFLSEIETTIRENPWLAVLTAAAVGYTWARIRR